MLLLLPSLEATLRLLIVLRVHVLVKGLRGTEALIARMAMVLHTPLLHVNVKRLRSPHHATHRTTSHRSESSSERSRLSSPHHDHCSNDAYQTALHWQKWRDMRSNAPDVSHPPTCCRILRMSPSSYLTS